MAAPAKGTAASDLEPQIDALYQRPLAEFTAARNALAKSLAKPDATRVKALTKPSVIPWAVNQVYWRARSVYDALIEAGESLRAAQITAIEKPGTTDARIQHTRDRVREATAAHRQAVADAVHQALRLAGKAGTHPQPDALTRMFEAMSLAAGAAAPAGRLTEVIQPAGFEALLGVAPAPAIDQPRDGRAKSHAAKDTPPAAAATAATHHSADAERARRTAARERLRAATKALVDARDTEQEARDQAAQSARALKDAERAVERAQAAQEESEARLQRAVARREAAEREREQAEG